MRNVDIEWVFECLITSSNTHLKVSKYHNEIEKLLSKYEKVFGDPPLGRPLDIGVEHTIELDKGTQYINMHHYRNPKKI